MHDLYLGAHNSAQGGVYKALLEAQAIGASTLQLFTRNQKRWEGGLMTDEEIALWKKTLQDIPLKNIMSHDSYLINLGSPDPEILRKSVKAFTEELRRCHQLDITFLNFHPGAATGSSEEACLDQIIRSLRSLEPLASQGSTRLLLETTAGQGTSVGYKFEHIAYLLGELKHLLPIGVCIDTCHIFVAGYDIRTKAAWEETLKHFDQIIGLKHLYAFHVNDSMKPFRSRRDRHAPLGKGEIGLECFEVLMTHPKLRAIPKYLETPDGPPLWKEEIHLLKEFATHAY